MLGYEDIAAAAAGEERDALWRSLAEDLVEEAATRRGGRGFVRAERPADVAGPWDGTGGLAGVRRRWPERCACVAGKCVPRHRPWPTRPPSAPSRQPDP